MDLVTIQEKDDRQQDCTYQQIGFSYADVQLIGNTDPEQRHRIAAQIRRDRHGDADSHDCRSQYDKQQFFQIHKKTPFVKRYCKDFLYSIFLQPFTFYSSYYNDSPSETQIFIFHRVRKNTIRMYLPS